MPIKSHSQSGFALILAILALMLLTFLGLTLSATTSTELQIATNYRWSQQAYYNAEAGIEAAKIVLRNVSGNWALILPAARTGTWPAGTVHPAAPSSRAAYPVMAPPTPVRHWEGSECDPFGTGYGVVLDDFPAAPLLNAAVPGPGPYQNVTSFAGRPISGAFTLWVKRDVIVRENGQFQDWSMNVPDPSGDTTLVLTSEGVAPIPNNIATAAFSPRAVRVLQVKLTYQQPGNPCDSAEGQAGTTASGANFGACAPLAGIAGVNTNAGAGGGGDTGVK